TNFNGLIAITQIGGDLFIGTFFYGGNSVLNNLSGLESLTYVAGDVKILNNPVLTSLMGLDNLASIGSRLLLSGNPLPSLAGLENLTSIGNRLYINRINTLTNLTGLENLTSIGSSISISENDALTSLTGLENLTSIGSSISISDNYALTSLTGLDNIAAESIEDLSIFDNSALSNCSVQCICDYLASPNGVVIVNNNATGCNNPSEIADGCGFTIPCLPFGNYYFNTQADIDSFQTSYPGCTILQGLVIIHGDNITNLNGLNAVTSFENDLQIMLNPALTNLTGLNNVNFVGNFLFISQNNALISLTGLDNLVSIGQDFHISSNESLMDITALTSLNSIGNSLSFVYNWELTSLSGLDNIDSASILALTIRNNYSLSDCDAQSICNYLASPNGLISIQDNATGCNSPEEVTAACLVDVSEQLSNPLLTAYPNPFTTSTTFSYTLDKLSTVTLNIYNPQGQLIERIEQGQPKGEQQIQWNAEGLPAGMYYFRIQAGGMAGGGKIIKISDI
ncbi:MAG: T9SS type A sorting domain-containing protein, partial [Bacteroidota bacterium]|nr:T9SS type A sorting domain-containing protein [Bacteroidota bacterium]